MKTTTLLLVSLILVIPPLTADPTFDPQWLKAAFPNVEVVSVGHAPMAPWLEVVMQDGQVVYVSEDGTHLMAGSLLDLRTRDNLTERRRDGIRQSMLAAELPPKLFEFPAPDSRAWVTVVTDIDCPYCRHLHQQMADYHQQGISVRYLMMPRAGLGTESHAKAEAAACAAMPEDSLTRAMNGEALESGACVNTIDEQFRLARRLNVTGTPAIIAENGRLISGFVPPERLAAELGLKP